MSLTRADLEWTLVRRTKRFLELAEMDYTTVDGTNDDLADPIATGLRSAGYRVASRANVADSDLAKVVETDEEKVIALAELRTLQTIDGNLVSSRLTTGAIDESYRDLTKKIESLMKMIEATYGILAGKLTDGMGFREVDDSGQPIEAMFKRQALNWKIP